jgi:hypothetical protein
MHLDGRKISPFKTHRDGMIGALEVPKSSGYGECPPGEEEEEGPKLTNIE